MRNLRELPENESKLNQLARRALLKSGEIPKPTSLYCLQLVQWALKTRKLSNLNDHFLLFLELLEGSDPRRAMRLFEEGDNGKIMLTEEERSPLNLAYQISKHLHSCMIQKVEGYRELNPAQLKL